MPLGQRLGLDVDAVGNVFCATIGQAGDIFSFAVTFYTATATESLMFSPSGVRLNLSAVSVESDADRDGFGDVTEDPPSRQRPRPPARRPTRR